MPGFNWKRRAAFKGLGAAGLISILGGCDGSGDGDSEGSPSDAAHLGQAPVQGNGVGGTNKLLIDASDIATGIPANIPVYAYITGLVKVPGQVFYRYDPVTGREYLLRFGSEFLILGGLREQ